MNLEEKPTYLNKLQSAPIFCDCSPIELVKLLPHITEEVIPAGLPIFKTGDGANHLYYLYHGSVTLELNGKAIHEITEGFFGEEAAVSAKNYLCNASTTSQAILWKIPSTNLRYALGENNAAGKEFYSSLFGHYSSEHKLFANKPNNRKEKQDRDLSPREWMGWVLAVILPIMAWGTSDIYDLNISTRLFFVVFSSISVMWVFRLVAEFVACILGVLALIILGVAPPSFVLQGFSHGEFFMAMSVFGIGAVLATSGLTFRLVLLILKYVPSNPFSHFFSMIISGVLLTPILPSANGRIVLISPLLQDMLISLKYTPKGNAANSLAVGTFMGNSLFSSVFLTSKPINFVVFGMLSAQLQEEFGFVGWLTGALASGIVLLGLCLIGVALLYRSNEKPRLSQEQLDAQLNMLGPLSALEWFSIVTIGLFILGNASSSLHKIETPWIALIVLVILLTTNILKKKEFQEKVDWSFILYLAGLIGLVKTMSAVGIDAMIAKNLTFFGEVMHTNFPLFILELFVIMTVTRIVVPNNAAIAIFCTILIPLAQSNGVNPWVVGYIILTFSDGWVLPFQCTYYLLFHDLTKGGGLYDPREVIKFNLWTNVFRLIAVFVSIPYWKWLGFI